jgi:hypothetical protein
MVVMHMDGRIERESKPGGRINNKETNSKVETP